MRHLSDALPKTSIFSSADFELMKEILVRSKYLEWEFGIQELNYDTGEWGEFEPMPSEDFARKHYLSMKHFRLAKRLISGSEVVFDD